jgi:hypothetical protein
MSTAHAVATPVVAISKLKSHPALSDLSGVLVEKPFKAPAGMVTTPFLNIEPADDPLWAARADDVRVDSLSE